MPSRWIKEDHNIMNIRLTGLAALVAASVVVAGGTSQAAFTYSTSQAPSTATSGGSTLTLTPVTSVTPQTGTLIINAVNVALTSNTAPPATDVFSLTFNDTVTINVVGDSTVTLRVNQTLAFFRADTGGEVSTDTLNVADSVLTGTASNGNTYTISAIQYAGPTVNNPSGGDGNISYVITETLRTSVPEPASVGMMALGLGFAGLFGVRRSRRRTA
jgi:hypothetical protein